MKKALSALLLFTLLFSLLPGAWAAGPAGGIQVSFYDEGGRRYGPATDTDLVQLTLDGAPLTASDVPALIQYAGEDGRTLVPVRLVAEQLGVTVLWVAENRQVLLLRGEDTIVLTLGSTTALVNGLAQELPGGVPAGAVRFQGKESTMVPLRFVSEQLGATVDWDGSSFTAAITSPGVTPPPPPITPEPNAPAEGDRGYITGIYASADALTVEIVADHTPEYRVLDLGDRLVVDLLGAVHISGRDDLVTIPVDNDYITAVRYAQHGDTMGYGFPHTLRVVLDLKPGITYARNITISSGAGSVLITARPTEGTGGPYVPTEPLDPTRRTIALDAGHGGDRPGAVYEGILEKDLNLSITTKLEAILRAKGYNVVLTRPGDSTVDLYARADIANAVSADVFVSIHCNAAVSVPTYAGGYTYYHPSSNRSKRFAQTVQAAFHQSTGCIDRGIRPADFVVLRETDMAAVLVECGFMTNHEELMRLCDSAYQEQIAQGVAEGIVQYLNTLPPIGGS